MDHPAPDPPRLRGVMSGLLAGALALGVSELLAGLLPGAPSPIIAVGSLVVALQPPGAKQLVVDLFGTADKLALEIVVAIVALLIAALLGVVAVRHRRVALAGFAATAMGAALVALRDPLTDPLLALVSAALATTAAWWVLRLLLPVASATPLAEMPDWARRRFLGTSLALAGGAVLSTTAGRLLLDRRRLPTPGEEPVGLPAPSATAAPLPPAAELDVPGITPIVMPNDRFYRIDTQLLVPRLDARTWRLTVTGLVEREVSLSYDELLGMPLFEQYVTIACVSNEVGDDLVGNARWTGVRLRELLDRAGVQSEASQVVGRAFDGWTCGFPTSWLDEPGREAMVAVGMNGVPLPPEHGFPARLIVPGLFGYVSATKWLTNIELTRWEAYDAYWVPLGWAKFGPILTQSRIDTPRGGSVPVGAVPVAGVAWAPDRGVSAVQVQVDEGDWQPAEISTPISDATWVQWLYRWQASAGEHRLRVRAIDNTGAIQEERETPPAPDGARGYHTVRVSVG